METIYFAAIPVASPHLHLRRPLPQKLSSARPLRFSARPLRVRASCCQLPSAGTSNSDDDGHGNSNMGGGGGGRDDGGGGRDGGGGGRDGSDASTSGGSGGGGDGDFGAALLVWAQVGRKLVGNHVAQMEVAQVFTTFMLACVPPVSRQLLPRTNARFDGLSHRTLGTISKIALVATFCFFSGGLGKIKGICPKLLADGTGASMKIAPTLSAGRTSVSLVGTGVALTEAREVDIPVVPTPEKVEDNDSWSGYNIDTKFSLGILADLSSMLGSCFHETLYPAAMWKFSGRWSGYSSGKSGKNGTA